MHFVIFLPDTFYSSIASAWAEILEAIRELDPASGLTWEFVRGRGSGVSKIGTAFPAKRAATRKIDVLAVLAGASSSVDLTVQLLERQALQAQPVLRRAERDQAIVAATCAAAYLVAQEGMLNGRRATISWWLKDAARQRFPMVRWEPSRLFVKSGRFYTSGAGFAGLDLLSVLLRDIGFARQERQVRRWLVLPPLRESQVPYEEQRAPSPADPFEAKLARVLRSDLSRLSVPELARLLAMSQRTLARQFGERLHLSPIRWLQQQRIEMAKSLLHSTRLTIAEVCEKIGYEDVPSFTRLFAKTTGMAPREYRRELIG